MNVEAENFEPLGRRDRLGVVDYARAQPRAAAEAVAEDEIVNEVVEAEHVAAHVRLLAFGRGAFFQRTLKLARVLRAGRGLLEEVQARRSNQRDESALPEGFEDGRT